MVSLKMWEISSKIAPIGRNHRQSILHLEEAERWLEMMELEKNPRKKHLKGNSKNV